MRKVWRKHTMVALALCAAGGAMFSGFHAAEARPQYRTQFQTQYTKVADNNKINCLVCHEPKEDNPDAPDIKKHNNYGTALKAVIDKNEKDKQKIEAALEKIEPEDSAIKGKTFGDLLEEGKLPASKE